MQTALVTGANKVNDLKVIRLLAQQGFFVYLGSRNLAAGQAAAQQLHTTGIPHVEAIELDVT